MFSNLKMLQKGLLLVGVPLLFELVFVISLVQLLDASEAAVDRANNAKIAVSAANRILTLFFNAGTELVAYRATHDPAKMEQYQHSIDEVQPQLDLLETALQTDKNGPERFHRISLLCDRSIDLLNRSRDRDQLKDTFPYRGVFTLTSQMDLMSKELIAEFNDVVQQYKSPNVSMESALASRRQLRTFIMGGAVASVALALALAAAFTSGTVRRLSVLMRNTHHLFRKEPLQPLLAGDDEIAQLDKVFHDVNAALAAADRDRLAIEQLKRDFMHMVTHDLRSPLASVAAAFEVVKAGVYGQLSERGQRSLALTENSVNYMSSLIDDLLASERIESGEFPLEKAPKKLQAITENAVATIQNLSASRQISVRVGKDNHQVMVDETRLQQVITNLLHNAIKYSPDGSTISINFVEMRGEVEVQVTDQGDGVQLEAQNHIFDRFRQARVSDATVKRGSGLGLFLCKSIIELHGGTIGVRSQPGEGSTFWFRLPLYDSVNQ